MRIAAFGSLVILVAGAAVADTPGPCAHAPAGALPLRLYAAPCALPGTADDGGGAPLGFQAPPSDTPGLPVDGAVTIDSEADFARIYRCAQPSGISWSHDRLLVFRSPGDTATMASPRWLVVDGKRLVLALSWSERCQGVPPGRTAVAVALLVPRSAPRAAVAKICHPPQPPCLAP